MRFLVLMLSVRICALSLSTSGELPNGKCVETDRRALLDFKKSLIDDGNYLSSWTDTDEDCCIWFGVTCSSPTHNIIMLDLGQKGSGFLYLLQCKSNCSSLKLPYLTTLKLNDNGFTRIPKFVSSLSNLRYLDMSNNGIIDPNPYQLENLTKLRHIDLHGNKLTKFPQFIFSMSKLEHLDLLQNQIAGSVPHQLGNLSELVLLDFSRNGEMKINNFEWITNLSSLTELIMDNVDFLEATNWLNSIKILPSLDILSLWGCKFPDQIIQSSSFIHSNSITTVFLINNTFHSQLLPFMFNISTKLTAFILQQSKTVNARIPEYRFYNMTSMEVIDLSYNQFSGGIPKSFGDLCSIRRLDLSYNNLSGPLSVFEKTLSKCSHQASNFDILNLDQNEFEGTLPDLSGFILLRELHIAKNKLNGSLQVGYLPSNLRILDLSSNYLTGVISENHFLNLSQLKTLDLSMNSLVLNVMSDWIPPFQLDSVKLTYCVLGPNFPHWLRTQKALTELDISHSSISDVLPTWFWSFSLELQYINISSNHISGEIPNLPFKFRTFPVIDLSSNLFHGPLPMFLFNTTVSVLSNNAFNGSLRILCNSSGTSLNYLDLSYNHLHGKLPHCWKEFDKLKILNLESNNFSGNIPVSIRFLDQLESLRLRNNSLSGTLRPDFDDYNSFSPTLLPTSLKLLDVGENKLSGEIPAWIGNSLTDLIVLQLRSNNFSGTISSDICHLKNIRILDLAFNNISGSIPTCFNNFTAMVRQKTSDKTISYDYFFKYDDFDGQLVSGQTADYADYAFLSWKGSEREFGSTLRLLNLIDISSNQLTGNIPEEVTSLLGLNTLNLSRNNLVETIPKNIGKLTMLEVLDLSENQLSGEIPISLADSTTINYLDLSSNNLSGRIPSSRQLDTINASQYMGNPGLCGLPLPRKCPGDEDPHVENGSENNIDEEDEGWFDKTWLYAGAGSGFFTGFCVMFGSLLFITKWRHACLKVLYDMNDWVLLMIALSTARLKRRFTS